MLIPNKIWPRTVMAVWSTVEDMRETERLIYSLYPTWGCRQTSQRMKTWMGTNWPVLRTIRPILRTFLCVSLFEIIPGWALRWSFLDIFLWIVCKNGFCGNVIKVKKQKFYILTIKKPSPGEFCWPAAGGDQLTHQLMEPLRSQKNKLTFLFYRNKCHESLILPKLANFSFLIRLSCLWCNDMRLHINRQAFIKIRILLQFPCMSEWLLSAMGLAAVTSFSEDVATASAAVATGSAVFFFRTAVAAEEFLVTCANSMSASWSNDESLKF